MEDKGLLSQEKKDLLRRKTTDLMHNIKLSPLFWEMLKSHRAILNLDEIKCGGASDAKMICDLIDRITIGTTQGYLSFLETLTSTNQHFIISQILEKAAPKDGETLLSHVKREMLIQKAPELILKVTPTAVLWASLVKHNVLSEGDMEDIKTGVMKSSAKISELLSYIRTVGHYEGFVCSLIEADLGSVVTDILKEDISSYKQKYNLTETKSECQTSCCLHCSFVLEGEFSTGWPRTLNTSYIEEQIKISLKGSLGISSNVFVMLQSKPNSMVFFDICSEKRLQKEDVIAALQEIHFTTGHTQTISPKPGSVLIRDQWLDEFAKQVMRESHIPDRHFDKRIDLDTQYVKLRLLPKCENSEEQDFGENRPDHYQARLGNLHGEDIEEEDLLKVGEFEKFILIKGRAGIGKSTLIQHRLRSWACGEWATHVKVMFLLNLRYMMKIAKEMTLSELLLKYSVYLTPDPANGPNNEWFHTNQHDMGILLDGVDEVRNFKAHFTKVSSCQNVDNPEFKTDPLTWCLLLLARRRLPSATVIVSSRPFADLSLLTPTMRVELMGLTRERVFEFVEKNVSEERVSEVKQALQNNPILMSVSVITFYCAALCKVLGRDEVNLKTYTQITAFIIARYIERSLSHHSDEELPIDLEAFARLACQSMLTADAPDVTRLTFTREDLRKSGIKEKQIFEMCQAGLFTQTSIPDPERPGESETLGQFVHLSVQEFLAITSLLLHQPPKLVQDTMSQMLASGQFSMAQMFAYGVAFSGDQKNISKIISAAGQGDGLGQSKLNDLKKAILSVEHVSELQACQIIYESQSEELAAEYSRQKMADEVKYVGTPLTAIDINGLAFTFMHHPTLRKIWLQNVNLDHTSIRGVAELVNESKVLRALSLLDPMIDEACLQILEETLRDNTCLQQLWIGCCVSGDKGFRYLANIPQKFIRLQNFGLTIYGCTDAEVQHLLRHVAIWTKLHHLCIHSNQLTDQGVGKLADYVKNDSKLQLLALQSNQMTDRGVELVKEAMTKNTTLKRLQLLSFKITVEGVHHVAEIVKTNKTLREVKLWLTALTETGADHIFKALEVNGQITLTLALVMVDYCSDWIMSQIRRHKRIDIRRWSGKLAY